MSKVKRKMGFKLSFRITRQLRDIDFVKSELKKIIENNPELNKNFPSDHWLRCNGYNYISGALAKYHGGINSVRVEMGYKSPIRLPGYLKNWQNIEIELKNIIKQLGHFPTQKELRELGQSSIATAISAYHGGIIFVKNRMIGSQGNLESVLETYTGGSS